MRILLVSVAAAGLLQGCMAEAPQAAASAAAGGMRCIPARQITGRRMTSPTTLEFDIGPVTYQNNLPVACPGIEGRLPLDSLQIEVTGADICAGDSFRAFDPVQARAVGTTAFPRCRLGNFTRVESTRR